MSTCSEHLSTESGSSDAVCSDTESDGACNQEAVQSFLNLTNFSDLDLSVLNDSDQAIDYDFTRINREEWRTGKNNTKFSFLYTNLLIFL